VHALLLPRHIQELRPIAIILNYGNYKPAGSR